MSIHPSLYIHNQWEQGSGALFQSYNPATNQVLWEGHSASEQDVERAVSSAYKAFENWSSLSVESRAEYLTAFAEILKKRVESLSEAIAKETGKPLWEAHSEIGAMINKVAISIEAYKERCPNRLRDLPNGQLILNHKPHGVLAVLGPFNFPGHLPHGHIIPALLAGNTVVFKPSEHTPLVAELLVRCWEESKLPFGVLNLIQGDPSTGKILAHHAQIDGLLFTGSYRTGQQLATLFAESPGKILALELGGNNPIIIGQLEEFIATAYITIQSAFLTSGQRCSCARRLIVPKGKMGDEFLKSLIEMIGHIQIGPYDAKIEPFMGPLIHTSAAEKVLAAQQNLIGQGAHPFVIMKQIVPESPFLSPGLLDVTDVQNRPDEEIFGPLLQVIRVSDFSEALHEANRTKYGLTATLLSNSREEYNLFYKKVKAGILNWNVPTTGGSSQAPFGGIGCSGNQRPSGYYAADYCAYPVATTETSKIQLPSVITPGINL